MFMFEKELTKRCTSSPTLLKAFTNGMAVEREVTKKGAKVGEDKVSGLMFVDGFVGSFRNTKRTAET